ncbi:MAG: hypothetical protein GYA15_05995 [Leptolinea sp.]|jgi:hypothetical protein|nr:hypothetical protein [Leptolinea sp.]
MNSKNDRYRIDRTAFSITTVEDAHTTDKVFWRSTTPEERLEALENLRQTIYGYDPALARLQRVLEVIERK